MVEFVNPNTSAFHCLPPPSTATRLGSRTASQLPWTITEVTSMLLNLFLSLRCEDSTRGRLKWEDPLVIPRQTVGEDNKRVSQLWNWQKSMSARWMLFQAISLALLICSHFCNQYINHAVRDSPNISPACDGYVDLICMPRQSKLWCSGKKLSESTPTQSSFWPKLLLWDLY